MVPNSYCLLEQYLQLRQQYKRIAAGAMLQRR
jgi:hypothetical protein